MKREGMVTSKFYVKETLREYQELKKKYSLAKEALKRIAEMKVDRVPGYKIAEEVLKDLSPEVQEALNKEGEAMKNRFIIRTGSGLYRDKETLRHPEGKPHHRPVFMVWDTKPGKGGKENGPLCFEETKESAEKKCKRLNDQEDFDDRT